MEKKFHSELFQSILYILIGALLIIFRAEMLNWAMTIAGIFFIISGALDLIKKNWVGGGVSLAIGIAIILLGWLAVGIVILVLGILIAVKGIITLIEAIKAGIKNALDLVFPILTIVVGILLAFGNLLDIILIIAGILLAIDGAIGLVGEFTKKKD